VNSFKTYTPARAGWLAQATGANLPQLRNGSHFPDFSGRYYCLFQQIAAAFCF